MLSTIWNNAYPIIIAILFFELIIIIHEGGHFFAAKLMGVKVNEFSVGMGPKIFSIQKGETKYSLRWILFGGYCQMEGESEDSDDKRSFAKKRVLKRIFIVVAGAVMNLILGFIIVLVMVSSSSLVGTTQVAKFDADAKSSSYGLQVGDKIKSIDGMRTFTTSDITTAFSRSDDGIVDITISRNGKTSTLKNVNFGMKEYDGRKYLNMDFFIKGEKKNVGNVLKSTVLESVSFGRQVFLSVHDMIVGKYGLSDLSGPVGAVNYVSKAVKTSVFSMLNIMALLTINVGIFNLFPIPALDGWRLFLLIFEGIFKKKMPEKFEWAINGIGLILLLGLMFVVTFSDISKIV